ncbi:MAG: hypothetical protein VYA17_16080 [Pseudomonadota bacterium]|nr:hypothetical protein [Pseudomonadota bacterium]
MTQIVPGGASERLGLQGFNFDNLFALDLADIRPRRNEKEAALAQLAEHRIMRA